MSNAQVGTIYQQIIMDVIEASRVDFEEGGVDEGVLDELKQGWQKKLSQQQLAQFPWDPKPDPPPTAAASAPAPAPPVAAPVPVPVPSSVPEVPSSDPNYGAQPAPAGNGLSLPMPPVKSEPGVKTEPDNDGASQDPQDLAHQRAAQTIQAQFGDRAAGSINKLRQASGNPAAPQAYPTQYQGAPQGYQQQPPADGGLPMPNGQGPANSQLDGPADSPARQGVLMRQGADGQNVEMGRVDIDNLLHAQIAARAKAMEGGGLMVPLKRSRNAGASLSTSRALTAGAGPSQFDGADDDDEEEDEDAINSDLDDPDDNVEDDDDDDEAGQIMLCMYDKVQRVKNKWKCVLKDGVLNVNGKDYVFHKATGEYEW